jgi:ABC-type multidrug transport system fused ATPase/permease subunit
VAIDWKFSLTTLVLFPLCIVPVVVFGRKVRSAGKAEEKESAQMSIILQETFAGMRVIKSFARESYQTDQFAKSSDTQCRNSLRVRRSSDIVQPLIESVAAFGVVLAMVYVLLQRHQFYQIRRPVRGHFHALQPRQKSEPHPHAHAEVDGLGGKCIRSHGDEAEHHGQAGCQGADALHGPH